MRISTKCSIAVHLLVVLVVFKDRKLTSNLLSKSVGCNPVIVRNILGDLKRADIVNVQRGSGGAELLSDPAKLTLWDVYEAVEPAPLHELIGIHPSPSPNCPIGANIYSLLEKPYFTVAESVKTALQSFSLQQILDEYDSIKQ